jgi:hypothetical protein
VLSWFHKPLKHSFKDPLVMASLHTAHQVALHKPLQSAPSGKWNSMHARIARFIYQEQKKKNSKEEKTKVIDRPEQGQTSETSTAKNRTKILPKKKKTPLTNR